MQYGVMVQLLCPYRLISRKKSISLYKLNKNMMRKILSLLFFLAFCIEAASQVRELRLFRFERSTNDNIVCYDVRLKNGKLDMEKPMDVYWSKLSHEYRKSSGLNLFERRFVFGYNIRSRGNDEVSFVLRASSKKLMHVRQVNGKWRAVTDIAGRKAYITRMYVKMKSAMKAEYLDIHGRDMENGNEVSERLKE